TGDQRIPSNSRTAIATTVDARPGRDRKGNHRCRDGESKIQQSGSGVRQIGHEHQWRPCLDVLTRQHRFYQRHYRRAEQAGPRHSSGYQNLDHDFCHAGKSCETLITFEHSKIHAGRNSRVFLRTGEPGAHITTICEQQRAAKMFTSSKIPAQCIITLLVGFCTSSLAAHWQATLSKDSAGNFPELRPLRASYRFGWSGLTAATGEVHFTKSAGGKFQFEGTGRTIGLVRV